jgi:hypothetical protein
MHSINLENWIANPCYLKEQPSIISGRCENWLWTSQDGQEVVFLVLDITGGCRYNLVPQTGGCPFNFSQAGVFQKSPVSPGVTALFWALVVAQQSPSQKTFTGMWFFYYLLLHVKCDLFALETWDLCWLVWNPNHEAEEHERGEWFSDWKLNV